MRGRDQFIERHGVRLRYRAEGHGPTVLLIHGWALDLEMWSPQFSALASRYRVVAFDRRGFGESTGLPSIQSDLFDIESVFDALNIERAALLGMSQGARSALRYALTHPQATTCLILDGPPQECTQDDGAGSEQPPMSVYRELAQRMGVAAVREAWLRHPLMHLRTTDPSVHSLLAKMIERYPGHDLLNVPSDPPVLMQSPGSLQTPTMVINGAADSAHRLATGAAIARWLPNTVRALIPDAGHLPNLDNPTAYNQVVGEFLHAHTDAPKVASTN